MNAGYMGGAVSQMQIDRTASGDPGAEFEAVFQAHHDRVARVIARVIRNPARAEEIAAEVFWKFWRSRKVQPVNAAGWLYRTAVRLSLNELRRHARAVRNEGMSRLDRTPPDPEQLRAARQEQEQVRAVLAAIQPREAEMLLLRSMGLRYEEVAAALELNPASIGTLISRAQQAFRNEFIRRYGEQIYGR